MEKYKTLIVDDQEDSRTALRILMSNHSEFEIVAQASEVQSALIAISDHQPDLIFLDIKLHDQNAFQILERIHHLGHKPTIIFFTAYNDYILPALKNGVFDYLLKPVDPVELAETLKRFKSEYTNNHFVQKADQMLEQLQYRQKIKINSRSGFKLISIPDIIYCEADGNYTTIFIAQTKQEVATINLGRMEKMLPQSHFFRANRSLLINLEYLCCVDRGKQICILENGENTFALHIPSKKIKELERLLG